MMDIHALTPQGELLVVRVVDGQVIVPPMPVFAPQTPISAESAGHKKQTEQ